MHPFILVRKLGADDVIIEYLGTIHRSEFHEKSLTLIVEVHIAREQTWNIYVGICKIHQNLMTPTGDDSDDSNDSCLKSEPMSYKLL